jgi:NhaA family Na+:H+ antiporter
MKKRSKHAAKLPQLPKAPVDRLVEPFERFFHVAAASGIVLLACSAVALALANSPRAEAYAAFWKTPVGFAWGDFELRHSLLHWINDGLMAIFFFVVGLEVKRELVLGELRDPRKAALPVAAALGGMLAPAGIYLALQWGQVGQRGWGIPMATDIAFVVGCMAVLGERVPQGLRIGLLTLAIVDDIGAILVIALGYSEGVVWGWLIVGAGGLAIVALFARLGVRSFLVYTLLGAGVWFTFHASGVHATVAGVILGLMTPARRRASPEFFAHLLERAQDAMLGDWDHEPPQVEQVRRVKQAAQEAVSPLEYLEQYLHPWVSFGLMPLFPLANAGVPIAAGDIGSPVALAVVLGLFLGKPFGVVLASLVAVRLGLARLPDGVSWPILIGGGFLAGIGFTMALFIAGLAFEDSSGLLNVAKVGVLGGSVASAAVGLGLLAWLTGRRVHPEGPGADHSTASPR